MIGSANVDFTVKVERLPQVGETVSGGDFLLSYGGKGANQALAAHLAGAPVFLIAKIWTRPEWGIALWPSDRRGFEPTRVVAR